MPFPFVLGCDRSEDTSSILSLSPPREDRTPHEFPEHHALRPSDVLHARHNPCEQDPPLAQYRLDALVPRLHRGFDIGDRVVGANALSPSGAAGQEAVVGSAQRVVEARTRALRDIAVQHCLEYFGFQHPDLELEGRLVDRTVRGNTSGSCTRSCVCAGRSRWTGRRGG